MKACIGLVSLGFLMTAAASVAEYKKVLRDDPAFAGFLIKYCDKAAPKSCKTIDRRKERLTARAEDSADMVETLASMMDAFDSLSVKIKRVDDDGKTFDFSYSHHR